MKTVRMFLLGFILFCLAFNAAAQKVRVLSDGFSIQFILGIPSEDYGIYVGTEIPDYAKFQSLLGFQLGNRWYLNDSYQYGIGLMINWLDATAAHVSFYSVGEKTHYLTLETSLLELGPIGTYAINDDMAIDGYYNLRPTGLLSLANVDLKNWYSFGEAYGIGITHTLGTAFRWRVLSIGFESVFGNIMDRKEKQPDLREDIQVNNFRFVIGAKF